MSIFQSLADIAAAAETCRRAQKLFFKAKSQSNLIAAKQAERALDELLKRYAEERDRLARSSPVQEPLIDPEEVTPFGKWIRSIGEELKKEEGVK